MPGSKIRYRSRRLRGISVAGEIEQSKRIRCHTCVNTKFVPGFANVATVDQNRQQNSGPTISMIVSKDIAWMDSNTPFLRGGATSGRAGNPPPGPGSSAWAPDELVTALYLPVLRVTSSTEITARIHSRARSSSFARSSGVSACPASLTQSRANSSNSFADSDDMGCSHNFRLSTLIMRFVVPGSITREAGTANCTGR